MSQSHIQLGLADKKPRAPSLSAQFVPPSSWPSELIRLLDDLNAISPPRLDLSARFRSDIDIAAVASYIFSTLCELHRGPAASTSTYPYLAVEMSWRSMEKAFGRLRPSKGAAKKPNYKSWYTLPMPVLFPCLIAKLVHSPDIWAENVDHATFESQSEGASVPALSSHLPVPMTPSIVVSPDQLPPPNLTPLFADLLSYDAALPSEELKIQSAETTSPDVFQQQWERQDEELAESQAELREELLDLNEAADELKPIGPDDLRDPAVMSKYGRMSPARNAFQYRHKMIPLPEIPQINSLHSLNTCHEFLEIRMVRAFVQKNGISLSNAIRYSAVIMQHLKPSLDRQTSHLLIAAPYTVDPYSILLNTPLLCKPFSPKGAKNPQDHETGWGYWKFFWIGEDSIRGKATESANSATRSRLKTVVKLIDEQSGIWDDSAMTLVERYGLKVNKGISMSQAGLLARLPLDRLRCETKELEKVKESVDAGRSVRSWSELLDEARRGTNADYFGMIRYEDVAKELGVTLTEARLVVECALYGLLEGPTNLNVCALGDIWRLVDVSDLLLTLRKESSLAVSGDDLYTTAILGKSGYNGGDFIAFCDSCRTSKSPFKSVNINQPFCLPVHSSAKNRKSGKASPMFEGIIVFSFVDNGVLSMIPLSSTAYTEKGLYNFRYNLYLSSISEESAFAPIKRDKLIEVAIVAHPFISGALALRAISLLPNGQVDWLRETGGSTKSEMIKGESSRWGSIRVFGINSKARDALGIGDQSSLWSLTKRGGALEGRNVMFTKQNDMAMQVPHRPLGSSPNPTTSFTLDLYTQWIKAFSLDEAGRSHARRFAMLAMVSYQTRKRGGSQSDMDDQSQDHLVTDPGAEAARLLFEHQRVETEKHGSSAHHPGCCDVPGEMPDHMDPVSRQTLVRMYKAIQCGFLARREFQTSTIQEPLRTEFLEARLKASYEEMAQSLRGCTDMLVVELVTTSGTPIAVEEVTTVEALPIPIAPPPLSPQPMSRPQHTPPSTPHRIRKRRSKEIQKM